jgi:hypothetical protein
MEVKKFSKDASKTTFVLPNPKESQTTYPFQWLLMKPQAHAVTPFETNVNTRDINTIRR